VEFADFQCPFCAKAHAPIQSLLDRHPEVAFVFKHLPLTEIHAQAMPAAQAAWAAGQQGKFWQYYNRLFEQADVLGESLYAVIAQELHLNPAKFNHDRHSATASQAISADLSLATRLGISATPVFLVMSQFGIQSVSGADVTAIESHITTLTPS
jgi:protein-disulfide isomerase